jgi:hypothetical protein
MLKEAVRNRRGGKRLEARARIELANKGFAV